MNANPTYLRLLLCILELYQNFKGSWI